MNVMWRQRKKESFGNRHHLEAPMFQEAATSAFTCSRVAAAVSPDCPDCATDAAGRLQLQADHGNYYLIM